MNASTRANPILAHETDPTKLHDLKAGLDTFQVYAPDNIDAFAESYLGGAARAR